MIDPRHQAAVAAEKDDFKRAFRHLVGGVCVITAGRHKERTGFASTSVLALETDPPSLTITVDRSSSTFNAIERDSAFGVSILSADHEDVARRFSRSSKDSAADRYRGASWRAGISGTSLLVDALAAFDCTAEETIIWHTHAIVIGRIREIMAKPEDLAVLAYLRGRYEGLGWSAEALERATHFR